MYPAVPISDECPYNFAATFFPATVPIELSVAPLISTSTIMLIGEVYLETMSTGIITQEEIDWLTIQQSSFSREEEAMALKIGRLLDEGSIQIGCRLLGERAAS